MPKIVRSSRRNHGAYYAQRWLEKRIDSDALFTSHGALIKDIYGRIQKIMANNMTLSNKIKL